MWTENAADTISSGRGRAVTPLAVVSFLKLPTPKRCVEPSKSRSQSSVGSREKVDELTARMKEDGCQNARCYFRGFSEAVIPAIPFRNWLGVIPVCSRKHRMKFAEEQNAQISAICSMV